MFLLMLAHALNSKWKGLCQGDPMSLFLFLIVTEGLNGILKKVVAHNKYKGFTFRGEEDVTMSMVQFADDTLFIHEASPQNVVTLKCILRYFELASRLKVNFLKSKLAGLTVSEHTLHSFASFQHCKTSSVPFTYLGFPVGGNPRRISF